MQASVILDDPCRERTCLPNYWLAERLRIGAEVVLVILRSDVLNTVETVSLKHFKWLLRSSTRRFTLHAEAILPSAEIFHVSESGIRGIVEARSTNVHKTRL